MSRHFNWRTSNASSYSHVFRNILSKIKDNSAFRFMKIFLNKHIVLWSLVERCHHRRRSMYDVKTFTLICQRTLIAKIGIHDTESPCNFLSHFLSFFGTDLTQSFVLVCTGSRCAHTWRCRTWSRRTTRWRTSTTSWPIRDSPRSSGTEPTQVGIRNNLISRQNFDNKPAAIPVICISSDGKSVNTL